MTLAITCLEYYVYLTGHLLNDSNGHRNALRRVAQGLVFHATLICTCVAYYKVVVTGMQPLFLSVCLKALDLTLADLHWHRPRLRDADHDREH